MSFGTRRRTSIGAALLGVLLLACAPAPAPTEEAKMWNPEWVDPEFVNDGGPMMVLSRHLLDSWRGSPPDDALGGDYGRAVNAPDGVATIPVGVVAGVVFGNSPDVGAAQWLRAGDTWIAVGWSASDDGAILLKIPPDPRTGDTVLTLHPLEYIRRLSRLRRGYGAQADPGRGSPHG